VSQHLRSDDEHQRSKQQQKHRRGKKVGEFCANKCAAYSARRKERGRPPIEIPSSQMQQTSDHARSAYDDQRHADGLLCGDMGDINQDRQRDN